MNRLKAITMDDVAVVVTGGFFALILAVGAQAIFGTFGLVVALVVLTMALWNLARG